MSNPSCSNCPSLSVLCWKPGDNLWQRDRVSIGELCGNGIQQAVFAESQLCIIFASANKIRKCSLCQSLLSRAFCMPSIWWSDYSQNSNGYLGSDVTRDKGFITGFNTWAYFETKQLDEWMQYQWYKINIFIRWLPPTKQTVVVAFDTQTPIEKSILNSLQNPDSRYLSDPFWVYARLSADVVGLQDAAVWAIRDHIRKIEKQDWPQGKPQPNYRHLHDIARHAIHVSESLNVASETMGGILLQHSDFLGQEFSAQTTDSDDSGGIHRQLLFCKGMIDSLRHRSASNRERLQNEIQLAFNTVAQYDTGVSVQIGHAAQVDGAAMKTVAFVTMTFLPATFISAVFSMSFFDFEADSDSWKISSKLWIYWAFTIPITLATFLLWYFWHKIFPPTVIGQTSTSANVLR